MEARQNGTCARASGVCSGVTECCVPCTRRTRACVAHVPLAHAVLRCAALRYASLRVARAAKHMPPWGVSQGGYLRGSVLHVCAVSACAQFVRSTLSVSCGAMHVDDDLFRAW